jgi:hypothetical protein
VYLKTPSKQKTSFLPSICPTGGAVSRTSLFPREVEVEQPHFVALSTGGTSRGNDTPERSSFGPFNHHTGAQCCVENPSPYRAIMGQSALELISCSCMLTNLSPMWYGDNMWSELVCTIGLLLDFMKSIPTWQKQCCQIVEIIKQLCLCVISYYELKQRKQRKSGENLKIWISVVISLNRGIFLLNWGEASSGPGNTELRKSNNKPVIYWISEIMFDCACQLRPRWRSIKVRKIWLLSPCPVQTAAPTYSITYWLGPWRSCLS